MTTKILFTITTLLALCASNCFSQTIQVKLSDLREPIGEWYEAGDVKLDPDNEQRLFPIAGSGVFINGEKGRTEHFVTKETFGDIELELEFMIASRSNSGVYLQGRYEIQILDSYGKENPGAQDCGGIYYRWIQETREQYEGTPPPVNACKPAGEWQHYRIRFRAPRFNAAGEKIKNAVFEEVVLNGITLHKNVEVTGPTRESLDDYEEPTGPLMLQGDHGPVAYRNIRITKL